MGFFSPGSTDGARGNIFTKIKDTTSSLLDAFVEAFVRTPSENGNNGKEVLMIDNNKVKLNDEQIQVKVARDMPLTDFFQNNLGDLTRPMPYAIREFVNATHFSHADTNSSLAIRISSYGLNGWKSGEVFPSFSIVSKHKDVGSLADSMRENPFILNELKEIGFEINDQNLINMGLLHEMGHLACYRLNESEDKVDEWVDFDDKLFDKFLDSVVSKEVLGKEDLPQEEWVEVQQAFYRELPMEHYSDEFAKFCMQTLFEPNGDFKSEIDRETPIPEIEVRSTLDDYDEIFTDLVFGPEYDGPENLAELYEEEGRGGVLTGMANNEINLSFAEAYSFFTFAEAFDKIQETPPEAEVDDKTAGWGTVDGVDLPEEVVFNPKDVKDWDEL